MVGLIKIKVPLKPNELTLENIQQNLPAIMASVQFNNKKVEHSYEVYKGGHPVLGKTRPYADQEEVNNIVVEQHIWTMVNFKCGYIYGNPIDFSEKGTDKHAAMQEYNDFLTELNFRGIVDNVAEWVYSTGVAYMFIEPKAPTGISTAPFKLLHVPSNRAAKIYSSYLDEEPLFDIIITPIEKYIGDTVIADYYILSIYTPTNYYEFEYTASISVLSPIKTIERTNYPFLPLIEFFAYNDKIGISESCETLQNALDNIDSNSLDNIQEFVNQLLVIRNAILGKTNEEKAAALRAAKKNGILEIFDTNEKMPADIKTLTMPLNNADINVLKSQIKTDMYSAWGVPLASTAISSGNVTQGGAEAANGWEHAYSVALKENNNMLFGFLQFIKISLWICKHTSGNNINTLSFSDIDIKYNIARSNNLQVKTQSFATLIENGVPPEVAWATCELSGDAVAIGKRIEEEKVKKQEEETKLNNTGATRDYINSEVVKTRNNINSEVVKTRKEQYNGRKQNY